MKYLTILGFFALAFPATAETIAGTASVIDGDTLEIHGQRIRLHAIDAPEGRQSCYRDSGPWRCGTEAARALSDLIGRRPTRCEVTDIDRYKRKVAICSVGDVVVNKWMVQQGWALAYSRYGRDYVADEREAERAGRGMWSGTFEAPWDWRRKK